MKLHRLILSLFLTFGCCTSYMPSAHAAADVQGSADRGAPGNLAFGLDQCPSGPEAPISDQEKNQIISEFSGNATYWVHMAGYWISIYWTVLLISLIASAFTASNLISDGSRIKWKTYSALLAALATSFLATVNPQAQSSRFREAFLHMKTAIETYKFDPRMTRCHLVRAYGVAESIVQLGGSAYNSSVSK